MNVYVVFSLTAQRPVLTTESQQVAKEYVQEHLPMMWSFENGRWYCPYVICDCYVTPRTATEDDEHPLTLEELTPDGEIDL